MRSSLKGVDISEGVDKEGSKEGKKLRRQRMQKEGEGIVKMKGVGYS